MVVDVTGRWKLIEKTRYLLGIDGPYYVFERLDASGHVVCIHSKRMREWFQGKDHGVQTS